MSDSSGSGSAGEGNVIPLPNAHAAAAATEAPSPVPPPAPAPAPRSHDDDPNGNIVYDVLYDVADLEAVGRLKWDIFSVERRLDRALREDASLAREAPDVHGELTFVLESFRANDDVAAYKERFVQNEERLKLVELIRFLELAVLVREPLHEAWARYLAWDHDRLLRELDSVDREGLARRPATLLQGVRETNPRRANAVLAHTERNARQVFKEIPYRDWSRVIAWHEEKNPQIANLIADARMLYLQAKATRDSAAVARQLKGMTLAVMAFTAIAAGAAIVALFRH